MTIIEAITRADDRKHNTVSFEEKLEWLNQLDRNIKLKIIDTHEGGENVTFSGYNSDTDQHTTLLVPQPFDSIYLYWLEAQIDYRNGEPERYNASKLLYNAAWEDFENYYNRTHRPVQRGCRFVF